MAVTGKQYAEKVVYAYNVNGGYIWGKSGEIWTEKKQANLEQYMVNKYGANWKTSAVAKDDERYSSAYYGRKWIGHEVWDCSGLTYDAGKKLGLKFYHGSNSSWNKDCAKKGKMKKGLKLPVGCWVYTGTDAKKPHIGTVTDDENVTEAMGSRNGVVKTKITNTKWKYWGLGKGIKFDFIPGEGTPEPTPEPEKPVIPPTLRRGAKGDLVKELQTLLNKAGSKLVVDGIFGSGTQSAVKAFQRRNGLVVDGIVGPKTWGKLADYR